MIRRIVAPAVLFASCCGIAAAQSIAIDQSCGDQGLVVFPAESFKGYSLSTISSLPDGSLAVVHVDGHNYFLSRHGYDGRFDSRFGVNGMILLPRGGLAVTPQAVMEDTAGRFLVAGTSVSGFAVLRLQADGRVDQSFGTGGVARVSAEENPFCQGLMSVQQ